MSTKALNKNPEIPGFFEKISMKVTNYAGSTGAFMIAFLFVIIWGASGPFFHYSDSWQMVINTGTTVITFLMVFLIQKAQNKDSLAIQLKLNELIAAHEFASNRLVNVESMSEEEMKIIQQYYSRLSQLTKKEESLRQSHSIDEAEEVSIRKEKIEEKIETDLEQ